jgi:cytochrome b
VTNVTSGSRFIQIWDLPTRLVHWLFPILLFGLWLTAELRELYLHRLIGYSLAGVLVFRLYWGIFGSTTARFRHFIYPPREIISYLRILASRQPLNRSPGHNPLGALSALFLLLLLGVQVTLGLFAVDVDGMESGPMSIYTTFEQGRTAAYWHSRLFDLLLLLIALHIIAALYYWMVKGRNLVARMLNGRDLQHDGAVELRFAPRRRLLAGIFLAGLVTWYLQSLDVPL